MTRPLLVLRPEPGATRTARAAAAMGLRAIVAPLFVVEPVAWDVPNFAAFDALLLTSANAVRHGGFERTDVASLPVYAVGEATAAVARAAGYAVQGVGDADAEAILALAARDGVTDLLHLAGREHRSASHPELRITRRIVYASQAADRLPDAARAALGDGAVTLLHSPRSAALFATLAAQACFSRAGMIVAALSPAVATAAGEGWHRLAIADRSTDDALLAAAARLCDG